MRVNVSSRGYTILEVMMFLAISSFMFVIASVFVTGKQDQAEFKQAMNDINTQVQQVINDVSNGAYSSRSDYECTVSGGSLKIDNLQQNSQGSNLGCVFLGRVIQFGVNNGSAGSGFNVYTVAGSQYANGASSGLPPASFAEALPKVVDYLGNDGVNDGISMTETKSLEWGLQATEMYACVAAGACTNDSSAVGFFGSFASRDSNGGLLSGPQSVDVVAIPNTGSVSSASLDQPTMVKRIDTELPLISTPNTNYVAVCFKSSGGHYGLLNIGSNGGQRLTTEITLDTKPVQVNAVQGNCPS